MEHWNLFHFFLFAQVLATFFAKMANKRGLLGIPEDMCEADFVLRVCGRCVRSCSSPETNAMEFFPQTVKRSHKGHGVDCGSACVRPQSGVPVWRQTAAQLQLDPSVPEERGGDPPGPGDGT